MGHKMINEYTEKIVNAQTGEETFREYTADEKAAVENAKVKAAAELVASQAKADSKNALLVKLGISDDEAKLLLS
jgi:hypothetical protein